MMIAKKISKIYNFTLYSTLYSPYAFGKNFTGAFQVIEFTCLAFVNDNIKGDRLVLIDL